ncbi:hypothetical protein PFHG_03521 [Plasmodium falciparum HB3]|uniref:Erythrocyte membrane protein 1 n=6 Tax=Plasmodium falciparum TaxID=5833 RepID=A0A0L7KFC3_PLAFX|nr:hypothetical protein PFHG_03521 [Plasmodium falciparum HB3]
MGNTESSLEGEARSPSIIESENSPRNVLERYAKNIRRHPSKDAKKHVDSLKGDLTKAEFRGGPSTPVNKHNYYYSYPCNLDHKEHTNLRYDDVNLRHPCHGREQNRFDEDEESECGNKIRNYKRENDAIACAPPRRRHMCDKNLEALNDINTQNIHDLLGNVLVTAKYEGESIVNNHPHKGTSDVCTALARSFADIGDIIRGIDMFKPNVHDKVEKGLREVFKKIHDLNKSKINDYDGDGPEYYKLREAWWTANRDQVWKAITCGALPKSAYVLQSENNTQLPSYLKCGHNNKDDPPTNLDYVPQYLRWFDEWGEEFCRKRNIKLKKVKDSCRNDKERLYCSHDGYDCTTTIWKKGSLHLDNKCTDCLTKCNVFEVWLGNQQEAFKKQKEKYEKEIESYVSNDAKFVNNINSEYYKQFYEKLKETQYATNDTFLNLLNEGKYCKGGLPGEKDITFTNSADDKGIFYRSEYCQVCPDCGVKCDGIKYTHKSDNDRERVNNEDYKPPWGVKPTNITVLYSGNEQGDITQKLENFCNSSTNYKDKNNQKWECYYKDENINRCKLEQNTEINNDNPKIISFHNFFELWVTYLLRDTIKWNDKLKTCINNTTTHCIDECNRNCLCFDRWVKQKEEEWNSIKKLFTKKKNMQQSYYSNINNLFEGYFFKVMDKLDKNEAKWKELMENIKKKKNEFSNLKNNRDYLENAIELLLDHLKETSTICKDNNTNEACETSHNATTNPCVKPRGGTQRTKNIKEIAQYFKRSAYEEARNRGLHKLKGKAHEGIYKRGGRRKDFKDNLCRIMIKHSNRNLGFSNGPCDGKGTGDGIQTRFVVGTEWEVDPEHMRKDHEDVIMPPRRRHICTSNLEHLQTDDHPLNGNIVDDLVNNSFLGDVLLSAKYEANKIIRMYKEKNNLKGPKEVTDPKHQTTICRAIRYSFADIGDIIRGRDLWERNGDMVKLQGHLETVFGNIHKSLKGKGNDKYNDDAPKYLKLRENWWEANRAKVWEAMKCDIKYLKDKSGHQSTQSSYCGYSDHTPLDDYIPQKLRWMTEWAEWYCKVQKKEYDKLKEKCKECKDKDNGQGCTKESGRNCTKCTEACNEYNDIIGLWKEQWNIISDKYKELHEQAQMSVSNSGIEASNVVKNHIDRNVIEFLSELYQQNGGKSNKSGTSDQSAVIGTNTTYENVGAYLHDTGNFDDCQLQNEFCDEKSDGKDKEKYAFRDKPQDHDGACGCKGRPKQTVVQIKTKEKAQEKDTECKTVNDILKENDGQKQVEDCHPKKNSNGYPDWKCGNINLVEDPRVCMPPRRQKLCVHFLANDNEIKKLQSQVNLKEAFIKSAAAETFFSWYYYKSKDGEGNELDKELKEGKIPPAFLRSMFYTFGDYRDFLFGTDISKGHGEGSKLKEQIDSLFKNGDQKPPNGKTRQEWWTEYSHEIWEAMLCALVNIGAKKDYLTENYGYNNVKFSDKSTTLEEFAKRPQFLRWLTEWYDDYCYTRQKYLKDVKEKCKSNDQLKCDKECNKKCEDYEKYMKKKKEEWIPQDKYYKDERDKKRFDRQHIGVMVTDYTGTNATDYLNRKFTASCGDKPGSASVVQRNIQLLEKQAYYDADKHCGCTKFIENDGKYTNISSKDDCKGLVKEANAGAIKWQNKGPKNYNNLKELTEEVLFPSRRLRICFHALDGNYTDPEVNDENGLRKRLMEVAATEGYNLGQYYKEKNEKEKETKAEADKYSYDVQPCSAMKYSFYDLRDIIMGYDNLEEDKQDIEKNMKKIFSKNRTSVVEGSDSSTGNPGSSVRTEFWNKNKECVWNAMICGYKKGHGDDNLPKECEEVPDDQPIGSNRGQGTAYQFLRWFTEWGEDFCKKVSKELKTLQKACPQKVCKDADASKKKVCSDACANYKTFIKQWREEYKKQSKKYTEDKTAKKYDNHSVARDAKDAREYLDKQLKKFCENKSGDCEYKCMKDVSTKSLTDVNSQNMPASLDDEPKEVEGKCNCQVSPGRPRVRRETPSPGAPLTAKATTSKKEAKRAPSTKPPKKVEKPRTEIQSPARKRTRRAAQQTRTRTSTSASTTTPPDVGTIVQTVLSNKPDSNGGIEKCNPKTYGTYPKWDCNVGKSKENENAACMPPRRQKLCINNIQYLNYKTENKFEKDIKEAFIKCAAIETYFFWLKYKRENPTAENELKNGRIPDEFKRIMYYTYGDYKDIFFGTDISNENKIITITNSVTTILKNENNKKQQDKKKKEEELHKKFWEENKKYIWEGMLYGLTHQLEDENEKKKIRDNYQYEDMNKLTPSLEDFVKRPQFLRWFTEWAEEFCNKRKEQLKKLEAGCKEYECNGSDDGKTQECAEACVTYQKFIKKWKTEYERQREKFKKDKDGKKYKNYPSTERDIEKATCAHEYLNMKLKEFCGNKDCSCMEKPSSQLPKITQQSRSSDANDMPESLDYDPEEFNKCECPELSKKGSMIHTKKIPEPKIPMNCVEKAAYYLSKEAENNLERTLKPKITHSNCVKETDNSFSSNKRCDPNKPYAPDKYIGRRNPCENREENRFKLDSEWKCYKNIKLYQEKKRVCVPPRRENMCISNLDEIKIAKVNQSNYLLNMVRIAARNEGIDIIKNFNSENGCAMNPICDTMKYSFADLGDIVRGTDMLRMGGYLPPLEIKLYKIFEYIYEKWRNKNKGRNKYNDVQTFRSAWWDANRKDIWKAMTCKAPEDAKLFRKGRMDGFERITLIQDKCGHKDDPPVDDYIPQRFRWMTEWSEYYCKALKEELEKLEKSCDHCKTTDKCKNDYDKNKCEKCKTRCQQYDNFVLKWKTLFDIQSKKYKELYEPIDTKNSTYDYVEKFVQKLKKYKSECSVESVSEYFHETSKCLNYKFDENDGSSNIRSYAFEETPKSYKEACSCTLPSKNPLDNCPTDKNKDGCKELQTFTFCSKNDYDNNLDNWNAYLVLNSSDDNKGVLIPPRRRHLCTRPITAYNYRKGDKEILKKKLLTSAFSQGQLLGQKYKSEKELCFEAMKYSYADYSDIIKGTDMMDTSLSEKIKKIFETSNEATEDRKTWWENNRRQIWHSMLCGYKIATSNVTLDEGWCELPKDEETNQFLRWLIEWAKQACKEKKHITNSLKTKCRCSNKDNFKASELLRQPGCQNDIRKYISLNILIQNSMENLNIKYKKFKDQSSGNIDNKPSEENVQLYIKSKYSECDLELNDINEIVTGTKNNENNELKEVLKKLHPGSCFVENKAHKNHEVHQNKKEAQADHPNVFYYFPFNLGSLYLGPLFSTHRVAQYDPKNDILKSSISVVVVSALGLIALHFMKKKFKSSVDLLRILNIPQGEYGMPTLESKNRYIPYRSGPYKGKTYIYMEGDTSGDEDKYMWDLSSSDITSSESEYEELDINDIYVPGSPKYKTLIEVVLEPSKRDISSDDIPSDDTPSNDTPRTNRFIDDEWNELKHDFVSQYLPNTEPNNNYKSADIPMNTEPNTLYFDNPEEKPFIISIHDRDLYTGKEISYNINMSTNTNNDIPMNARNDSYRGWKKDNDGGNVPIDNRTLNTDVSIQIDMDHGKPKKEFTNMDTNVDTPTMDSILYDLERHNEPFYDIYDDDVYYDVNDDNKTSAHHNNLDVSSKVQIEMDVNTKLAKEKYPISDVWDI